MLPMDELKTIVKNIGLICVRTYIQIANFVFQSCRISKGQISKRLTSAILKSTGFKVSVLVLSVGKIKQAIRSNWFVVAALDLNKVHLHITLDQSFAMSRYDIDKFSGHDEKV